MLRGGRSQDRHNHFTSFRFSTTPFDTAAMLLVSGQVETAGTALLLCGGR